jgi:hypothetical protein
VTFKTVAAASVVNARAIALRPTVGGGQSGPDDATDLRSGDVAPRLQLSGSAAAPTAGGARQDIESLAERRDRERLQRRAEMKRFNPGLRKLLADPTASRNFLLANRGASGVCLCHCTVCGGCVGQVLMGEGYSDAPQRRYIATPSALRLGPLPSS